MKRNELKGRIGNFLSTGYKIPYRAHDSDPYNVWKIFQRFKLKEWKEFFGVLE